MRQTIVHFMVLRKGADRPNLCSLFVQRKGVDRLNYCPFFWSKERSRWAKLLPFSGSGKERGSDGRWQPPLAAVICVMAPRASLWLRVVPTSVVGTSAKTLQLWFLASWLAQYHCYLMAHLTCNIY